jgi:hypothetical protein
VNDPEIARVRRKLAIEVAWRHPGRLQEIADVVMWLRQAKIESFSVADREIANRVRDLRVMSCPSSSWQS